MSNDEKLDNIISILNTLEHRIMATQEDITLLTEQVVKVNTEVLNLKASLEAQIADLEAQVAAGNAIDLTGLKAAVQTIDDITEDTATV